MTQEMLVYHNPRCSKSRGVLAILQERNIPCRVVEYLDTPLDTAALKRLMAMLDSPAHDLVRSGDPAYEAAGLSKTSSADELIAALAACPALMQRPIVVWGQRAIIARPPESIIPWLEG